MARLTGTRLLAVAGLLVVVTVGVVLFAHLLPTVKSSLIPPATTPASTARRRPPPRRRKARPGW